MTTIKSILEELVLEFKDHKLYLPSAEGEASIYKYLQQIEQLIEEANVTLNEVDVPANIDAYHYAVDILKIHKDNLKKVIR